MNTRNVVGQRIVEVRQARYHDRRTGRTRLDVDALVLENGVVLRTRAYETEEDGPVGTMLIQRKHRRLTTGGAHVTP